MNQASKTSASIKRAGLGALCGAVICLTLTAVAYQILSDQPPEEDVGMLLFLASVGAGGTAGAILGTVAGAWELRGRGRAVVLGALAGCLVGLVGAVLYTSVATGYHDIWGKLAARHRWVGLVVGAPAGSLLGGIVGFMVGGRRRAHGKGSGR
jgi:hypothetical protein